MGTAIVEALAALPWSSWEPLTLNPAPDSAGLRETIDGGQCFRWHPIGADDYAGVFGEHVARVRLDPTSGCCQAAFLAGDTSASREALLRFLSADSSLQADALEALPWRSDGVLGTAIQAFPGLRVLGQPLGEALLGFLCSPTKRIPQIKEAMGLLAEHFGEELHAGIHALPTWERLAGVEEGELRTCKLGYRARSIAGTAAFLQAESGFLDHVESLPYAEARAALTRLPGVGGKIADCVLLYGSSRLEPFPVDTWILQAMSRLYGLEGWKPEQVALFGRAHFGEAAGLAQQFLFAWMRQQSGAAGKKSAKR